MAHLEHAGGGVGPPFDPFSDPATSSTRWKAWMRNFQYYIEGQVGLADKQKVSRLLHQAGPEVQEIYDTLKENEAAGTNEYERCVARLNVHFAPILNTAYERQKFRNLEIKNKETYAQYVMRLRTQAQFCEFSNKEEALRDQVIEKCMDMELKRKFLKKGSDLTLSKVLEIAKMYEMEKDMFAEKTVKTEENEQVDTLINKVQRETTCFRCGQRGHIARDRECPAMDVKCDKCGIKGHFAKCCKTKNIKKMDSNKKRKKRYVRYVIEEDSSMSESDDNDSDEGQNGQSTEQVNSVFKVSGICSDNKCDIVIDNKVTCKFIIDSGASINIIDKNLFKQLLQCGVSFKKVHGSEAQKFQSYGGREIAQLGIYQVQLYSPATDVKIISKVLIYDGHGPALLSREASIQLNMLRLGPNIKNINLACKKFMTKDCIMKEYPNLFKGIGKLNNFKLQIPIDHNVKLVAQPVRRQPFGIRGVEENLIKELLDSDIIEPVTGTTPCVSPSHIVQKKEKGQFRLVVDMRKANEAVLRERVPLPTFEELLADLNGCKYFSSLDIKWGYHQVELDEGSRVITVFSSSCGLFRYKRLFFGIRCASEMFQRIIAQLLQGIEGVANSQDDIRIGGRTREEHDHRLRQVLTRLCDSGLTLNEKKCAFGKTEIDFLGHHLSENGIQPTSTSQQVVQEFRAPQNKAEVRSFLGLVNFSARFIPDFSTLTEPLRRLTRQDVEQFVWNEEHQDVFDKLKILIAKAPVLSYYDKNAETTLVTDASPVGIAAVLTQRQRKNGQVQPVAIKYISKALSSTEQRYSQTEKEALAIVWACESLYMYLIGKQFSIISDHKPLEVIYSTDSKPSARIQRWVLRLQPYTFKVIYKPGKSNIADPISRLLDTKDVDLKTEDNEDNLLIAMIKTGVDTVTIEEIQEATLNDPNLKELMQAIEKDVWTPELRKYELIKVELCIVNDIILRGTRIIVPQKLIPRVLELGHEGHISVNSMKAKLRTKVWWKGMDKDIEYWIDTCEGCRLVRQTYPEPIVSTKLPSKVWELVAIDYLGPLPSGHYLLFIVDYYSRYYEVEILRNQTAESTIEALKRIIASEGIMNEIVCDNGPAFRDERFKEFLTSQGIRLRHTTPLWPQANGEVERQNRNVLRRLRIAQGMKLDWKKELLTYLSAYRTTPHSSTGVPPGNLFRGRAIKTKIPEMNMSYNLNDEEIRDQDRYRKDCYKRYADSRRHAKTSDITPGDKVLVKQRKENKLSTPFSPVEHTVVWKSGNSVAAQAPDGKLVKRNSSYFQAIKHRDLGKFNGNEAVIKEKERDKEAGKEIEGQETMDVTDYPRTRQNTPDVTDYTQTRPLRERHMPKKYNDFLLALILDSIN